MENILQKISKISIDDFNYHLPEYKIAKHPLKERDSSKLLVFNGTILEDKYLNIADYIADQSLLIMNNTEVIPARLYFQKNTGAKIEIFCLNPEKSNKNYSEALLDKNESIWKCLVGNSKKWKEGLISLITKDENVVNAEIIEKEDNYFIIKFTWCTHLNFGEIIDKYGSLPIPPYLNRETEESDYVRYQTIYSEIKGSVAAPTAGLHFTEKVFTSLKKKHIDINFTTLHVGAGTFLPVKSETLEGHDMHEEQIIISKNLLKNIIQKIENKEDIVCVGTTSLRNIESLYWLSKNLFYNKKIDVVKQWDPYEDGHEQKTSLTYLRHLLQFIEHNNLNEIISSTKLIIAPGYQFKIANCLITNFHQPKSTLLLIISAIVGNKWREIYDYALNNNYRFLSYGDGCLLKITNS